MRPGYGVATVNGKPVTEDVLTTPLTRFDATVQYNTYNVAPLLREGDNALGVMLGNGWYNDTAATWDYEKAPWRHHPKLLAQLDLEYENGERETLVSGPGWRTAAGPITFNHVRCGEVWDARLEQPAGTAPASTIPPAAGLCVPFPRRGIKTRGDPPHPRGPHPGRPRRSSPRLRFGGEHQRLGEDHRPGAGPGTRWTCSTASA